MHAPAIHPAWHGLVCAAGSHAVGKPSTVTCRAETLTSRICSCEKQTCDRRGEPCCAHGALLLAARKGAWRSDRRLAAPAASEATLPCNCMTSGSRLLRVGQFHRGWKVGVGVGSWNRRTLLLCMLRASVFRLVSSLLSAGQVAPQRLQEHFAGVLCASCMCAALRTGPDRWRVADSQGAILNSITRQLQRMGSAMQMALPQLLGTIFPGFATA